MKVKKLMWDGNKNSTAEAIITDGKYECLTFCHPCKILEGQELSEPLGCFMSEVIMVSFTHDFSLTKDSDSYFGYSGIGQLVDKETGLIKLGDLKLTLDGYLPGDLEKGQFVEFKCSRIDIWD